MGRKRRRKQSLSPVLLPVFIVGLVFTVVIGGGLVLYFKKKNNDSGFGTSNTSGSSTSTSNGLSRGSPLSAALMETDRIDPYWRLADIAKYRVKLDPSKNGAPLALNAARQIPQSAINSLDGFDSRRFPGLQYPDGDVQRLRNSVRSCGGALTEARKMAFAPQGSFDINFNFERPLDTTLEYAQNSRKTAWLLQNDSILCSIDRDPAGAMEDVYCLLILARYFNDDPFLITQLVRAAISMIAISALERALACPAIPDYSLTRVQDCLEANASSQPLVIALRGERANYHATIECKNYPGANLSDADHAWAIRVFNRAIDVARRDPPYRSDEWNSLINDLMNGPPAATRIMPHIGKIRDAFARQVASLRAATIAIASERYRRDKGEWPQDLKALVPDYIRKLPTDPYTGAPFLHKRVNQGFSVYVQGPASAANGEFNAIGQGPDQCQGLRLLDPAGRR
jgi:hypothetical protein